MDDNNTNIQELKEKVFQFVKQRDWEKFHNPKNLAISIAIEASELMEIFQWLNEEESWDIINSNEKIHLKEEVADVIIYCMSLANQLDIDLSIAIEDKIKKNSIKYPIPFRLPSKLRGRNLNKQVIPTVCNLENMLNKLKEADGDLKQLKQWEKRSYKAYCIEKIENEILNSNSQDWKKTIKEHILETDVFELGASCIDIYLVAYIAENYGKGRENFFEYVYNKKITEKQSSAQAIWQVGKGDGVYLDLLNNDGTVKDWNFFIRWIDK